jgi:hypothetical protein
LKLYLQGAPRKLDRVVYTSGSGQVVLLHRAEKKIIGRQVLWSSSRRKPNLCLEQLWLNGGDDKDCYVVLESENICQVTLEPVRPNVCARKSINQLSCDPNLP